MQVLNRVSLAIAVVAVIGVVIILGALLGRGDSPGYSVVIAFVILVSSVPIGMPVVTTTVLAVGAREMAKQKAIVNRSVPFLEALQGQFRHVSADMERYMEKGRRILGEWMCHANALWHRV